MGERTNEVSGADRSSLGPIEQDEVLMRDLDETAETESTEDTEVIRADIEQTRADMSETIEAIQQKLSPETIKEQVKEQVMEQVEHAKETVREATIGKAENMVRNVSDTANEVRYNIVDTIQQNPIPAALVGLGLGWLFMNNRNTPRRPAYNNDWNRVRYDNDQVNYGSRYADRDQTYYGSGYADRGQSYDRQQSVGNTVERARDAAGNFVEEAQERVSDFADQAQYRAQRVARNVGNTASDAGSGFVEIIQENPIPAALAGISLAWLFMNSRSGSQPSYSAPRYQVTYGSQRYSGSEGYFGGQGTYGTYDYEGRNYQNQGSSGSVIDKAQETVGNVAGKAQETASNVANKAQETVSNVVDQTRETAENFADQVQYQAYRVEDRVQRALYENPLAVGATALALGAAVGLALPQTRREHELMGATRDTLVEKAQEVAQDTLQKVQQVAGQVVDDAQTTIKQETSNQGSTSSTTQRTVGQGAGTSKLTTE